MLLRKAQGGSTVGSYTWKKNGDVVEVDDQFAAELLRIPGNDFSEVAADAPAPAPEPETPPAAPEPAEPQAAAGHVVQPDGQAEPQAAADANS